MRVNGKRYIIGRPVRFGPLSVQRFGNAVCFRLRLRHGAIAGMNVQTRSPYLWARYWDMPDPWDH